MEKTLKILITGGSGFIGTNFVAEALKKNHIVYNIDNLSLFNKDLNFYHSNYFFSQLDIRQEDDVLEILNNFMPDKVINMAAESHVDKSINSPEIFINTNILGTYHLLEATVKFWKKVKSNFFCFHHVSTDEVFGSLKKNDKAFSEFSNYKPSSPYSASKAASDHLVRSWHKTYGLPISITHCGNNFGPYQSPEKLIPLTVIKCLNNKKIPVYGNGKNIRDWIFVKDHVSALLKIMEKNIVNKNYVIGSRNEKANIEVIKIIYDIYNEYFNKKKKYKNSVAYVEDRLGHDHRYAINPELIENEINWAPKKDFTDSIKETFIWYVKNKNWWENLIN